MSADGGTAPPKGSTSHCQTASSTSWGFPALPANLNPSNRPVRTRMPGGVAGDVELKLHAPMPICPPLLLPLESGALKRRGPSRRCDRYSQEKEDSADDNKFAKVFNDVP